MATTTIDEKGNWIFLCGDTLILSLTGLGNITARTNLVFTIKEQTTDADADAIVQIDETTGLLVINGATAAVAANGSITVTNATTGAVTVRLESDETVKIAACDVYYWDIKELAADDTRLKAGRCRPVSDITREVT